MRPATYKDFILLPFLPGHRMLSCQGEKRQKQGQKRNQTAHFTKLVVNHVFNSLLITCLRGTEKPPVFIYCIWLRIWRRKVPEMILTSAFTAFQRQKVPAPGPDYLPSAKRAVISPGIFSTVTFVLSPEFLFFISALPSFRLLCPTIT